ncbi:MAG: diguanylate cyclase [Deltaproteobacteria bacterium]|nr:diguanylate cyclase [Deltaproteobacteria bacterium]
MVKQTEPVHILLVDDKPANLLALESLLESPEVVIIKATSGNEALGLLLEYDFALVLLDVQMPDMDGFETAELMRSNEKTRDIPIIFVTAISKEKQHIFKGYESGAVDYLFKPLDPHILISKVKVFMDLHRQRLWIEKTRRKLEATVGKLKQANRKILEQQKAVIEEERLKVLLQMAGATAHELNQPLTGLLGTIELLQMDRKAPDKLDAHIARIAEAGRRIAGIVKKIQVIQLADIQPYQIAAEHANADIPPLRTLSIEDSDKDFHVVESLVKAFGNLVLLRSKTLADGLALLKSNPVDLVLAGFYLPDGTGLDLLQRMHAEGIETPVIVITGKGDEMIAAQVIQAGAYDYLPKDQLSERSLGQAINNSLTKSRLKKESRKVMHQIAEMSIRDVLTGLYNRRYFYESLDREISRAGRTRSDMSFCMMDLDHFKSINDTMGHLAGDMVLAEFGNLLKEWIRQSDLACRYGGEEFAVILSDTDIHQAVGVCERFRETLGQRTFYYNQTPFHVTVSIGISSLAALTTTSGEMLVRAADEALYQAKKLGRNRIVMCQ